MVMLGVGVAAGESLAALCTLCMLCAVAGVPAGRPTLKDFQDLNSEVQDFY